MTRVTHAATRPPRPRRTDFVHWDRQTTRWADIDVYGHMNNARYFELIDTVVNNHLIEGTGVDIATLDAIGVVAEVSCRYFSEVGYPRPVDVGVVVDHVGRSSVVYRVGLFQGDSDEAAAEGRFVHVYVDNTDPARPTTPIPDLVRSAVTPLLRPRAADA
jgi:acyl-CoA thioester hydrolase